MSPEVRSIILLSAVEDMKRLLLSTVLLALVHLTLHGESALVARDLPVHIAVELAVEILLRERDRSLR